MASIQHSSNDSSAEMGWRGGEGGVGRGRGDGGLYTAWWCQVTFPFLGQKETIGLKWNIPVSYRGRNAGHMQEDFTAWPSKCRLIAGLSD